MTWSRCRQSRDRRTRSRRRPEAGGRRPIRQDCPVCASERLAPGLGHEGEHRVGFERRIAREVDARVDLPQEPAGEKADVDVRCLRPALRITLTAPGSDRLEHARRRPRRSAAGQSRRSPAGVRTSFGSSGRTYTPSASACQNSTSASGTGAPSPSKTRIRRRIRSPGVSARTRQPSVALSASPK